MVTVLSRVDTSGCLMRVPLDIGILSANN